MSELALLQTFGDDQVKIVDHLSGLLPYLEPGRFALSGSVAMVMQLARQDVSVPTRAFNDLDLTICDSRVVDPAVAEDFMIAHYHPKDSYFALVDPQTRTKADLFTWLPVNDDQTDIELADLTIPALSLEALAVIAFSGLSKLIHGESIERKRLNDALFIWPHIDIAKAQQLWQRAEQPGQLIDFVSKIVQLVTDQPALVKTKSIKNRPPKCQECEPNGSYKLTPLPQVYSVLD